jgi:hypothetical protein
MNGFYSIRSARRLEHFERLERFERSRTSLFVLRQFQRLDPFAKQRALDDVALDF